MASLSKTICLFGFVLSVSVTVFASTDFDVTPTDLSFAAYEGDPNPDPVVITMTNYRGESVNWQVSDANALPISLPDWLSFSATSGTLDPNGLPNSQQEILLSVDTSGLNGGSYKAEFYVTASGTYISGQKVSVKLNVIGAELKVSGGSLSFSADEGGDNPDGQTFRIVNAGGGSLDWTIDMAGMPDWLTVTPQSGSLTRNQEETVTVSVDITGLSAGDYSHWLKITAPDASGSPKSKLVNLVIDFAKYDWSTNPGTGDPNRPYQISTTQQLMSIGSDEVLLSKHYILIDDIVFDPNNNRWHIFDAALIAPFIGRNQTEFTGTFDGQGHCIRNFMIDVSHGINLGLFGVIHSDGRVTNLKLYNTKILAEKGMRRGGLAGYSEGEISNCCVVGEIGGDYYVGGLVGGNSGEIEDCKANVRVVGDSSVGGLVGSNYSGGIIHCFASGSVKGGSQVGGIAGYAEGFIEDSHADVSVEGYEFQAGGLVGLIDSGKVISCSAKGNVIGSKYVGGLVGISGFNSVIRNSWAGGSVLGVQRLGGLLGMNYSEVSDCFATGSVKKIGSYNDLSNGFGGLTGFNRGYFNDCYAIGSVEGSNAVGGLVGWMAEGGKVSNCYSSGTVTGKEDVGGLVGKFWDIEFPDPNIFSSCYYLDTAGPDNGFGTPLSDEIMKQQASFVGWDFMGETLNGADDIWWIDEGNDYPRLWYELNTPPVADAGADITAYAWIDGLAQVQLDGTGSTDADGDDLEYFWYSDANGLIATGAEPNVVFDAGQYGVTLIVNDGIDDSQPDTCMVTVIEPFETTARMVPSLINLKSGRKQLMGRIRFAGADMPVLDPGEPMLLLSGEQAVQADAQRLVYSDEETAWYLVGVFDRTAVTENMTAGNEAEITLVCRFDSGRWVCGRDEVRVK